MNIVLDYVIDKFYTEDEVSVICNKDVAEELYKTLEDYGMKFGEGELDVLKNPRISTYIISKADNELYVEDLYNADGSVAEVNSEYVYLQYGLLNDREKNMIHSYKEEKILLIYNY